MEERLNDIKSKITNTDYNNTSYSKSHSSASLLENPRVKGIESNSKLSRYDNDKESPQKQQEDYYNSFSNQRKNTIEPNSSASKSMYRAGLRRDQDKPSLIYQNYPQENRTNTDTDREKDDQFSYNRIITMLEGYREMNEKLISNLNDKTEFSQPVIVDVEKRKKGVENLKEILDYISATKTLEDKRGQIIPFHLIDRRKLYENIVNYIFYNRGCNISTSNSPLNKSSSSSNFSSRKLSKFMS